MKIVVDGKVFNADITPVVLVFESDAERKHIAGHLSGMPEKEGVRAYASYPEGLDGWAIMKKALELTSNANDGN